MDFPSQVSINVCFCIPELTTLHHSSYIFESLIATTWLQHQFIPLHLKEMTFLFQFTPCPLIIPNLQNSVSYRRITASNLYPSASNSFAFTMVVETIRGFISQLGFCDHLRSLGALASQQYDQRPPQCPI